jgi:ornithine cyclodeaminase/alanine dehydrogenase-like protein (mu-crystallin family)
MEVLIVDQREVSRLLPMDVCMDAVAEALTALARGEALMPLRTIVWLSDRTGGLVAMPSALPSAGALGIKVITVFPGNVGTEFDSHQGAVLLFEGEHGRLLALMDATEITAIRTAAVSGVATRLLAREGAGDLAILGSGTQARSHLEAMLLVRPVGRLRVWSRTPERAEAFAEQASARHGIRVELVSTPRDAVDGADLICTTTSSPEPILLGEWLAPGAHVNAIGAVGPASRELDTTAVSRSRLYVDRRESAVNEAGEFVQAQAEGAIGQDHIVGEIGEVLAGTAPGRQTQEEITVFRGVGLAIEDLAAARVIYQRAVDGGAGVRVELGGGRHAGA